MDIPNKSNFFLFPFSSNIVYYFLWFEVFMLIIQKIWSCSHCCLLFCCPFMSNSVMPWTAACQASLSLTVSQSLPKFVSIALVITSSHVILYHPLLLLPSSSSHIFSQTLVSVSSRISTLQLGRETPCILFHKSKSELVFPLSTVCHCYCLLFSLNHPCPKHKHHLRSSLSFIFHKFSYSASHVFFLYV